MTSMGQGHNWKNKQFTGNCIIITINEQQSLLTDNRQILFTEGYFRCTVGFMFIVDHSLPSNNWVGFNSAHTWLKWPPQRVFIIDCTINTWSWMWANSAYAASFSTSWQPNINDKSLTRVAAESVPQLRKSTSSHHYIYVSRGRNKQVGLLDFSGVKTWKSGGERPQLLFSKKCEHLQLNSYYSKMFEWNKMYNMESQHINKHMKIQK